VLAAAAVALAQGRLALPLVALTGGGCEFEVDGELDGHGRLVSWSLAGDARLLARVEPMADADRVPAPPTWS